ncbi:MAG TPA: hypothetical protein VHU19_14805 [Pyrinomonadaceae bacterium]|jgi:hypothetical protein|nr:hypothetical protein [Pyrinomonadaceae bacterium]
MKNSPLPSRVVAAFVCALAALFGSTQSFVSRAQENFQTPPRVEAARSAPALVAFNDPEATYQGARIVHNVTVNDEKGMRVHANFRVRDGLGVPCMLIAYFYFDDQSGKPLRTDDPKYRTKSGTVYAHANFTPAYDPAVYNDLQLFMPYSALNMESGEEYDLKFYLALYDKEGQRFFGKSGWYKFHLKMP